MKKPRCKFPKSPPRGLRLGGRGGADYLPPIIKQAEYSSSDHIMDGASTVSYLLSSLSLSDTEVAFVSHAPVMTCEEASSVYNALTPPLSPPFCKNLFVKDKKGGCISLFVRIIPRWNSRKLAHALAWEKV